MSVNTSQPAQVRSGTSNPLAPTAASETTEAAHDLDGSPEASASALAAGSAAPDEGKPRPKKATCVEGAYRHDEPAFCLRVPDGYSPTNVKSGGVLSGVLFQSNEKGTMDLEVTWMKQTRRVYDDERRKLKEAAKTDDKAVVGKCHNNNGLYVRYQREQLDKQVIYGHSVVYENGIVFWCRASAFTTPDPPKGFVTACQTLFAQASR